MYVEQAKTFLVSNFFIEQKQAALKHSLTFAFLIFDQCYIVRWILKGQLNEIFYSHFFHYSDLPRPLTNGLKYFLFWLRFWRLFEFWGISLGMIPQSSSPGYHSPASQSPQGIILRRVVWLFSVFWFLFTVKGHSNKIFDLQFF